MRFLGWFDKFARLYQLSNAHMQKRLADMIRTAREKQGLSQGELGQLLGLPRTAITKIEQGQRHLTALELLSLANLFDEELEIGIEHLMAEIISDLAARIRTFLARNANEPLGVRKRSWLQQVLHKLDTTYVGEDLPA